MFEDSFKAFIEVLSTWEGFEDFVPKIKNLAKNIREYGQKAYIPNKPGHGYNVLNHGDFHLRNILLKINPEKVIDEFRFVSYE